MMSRLVPVDTSVGSQEARRKGWLDFNQLSGRSVADSTCHQTFSRYGMINLLLHSHPSNQAVAVM